MQFYDLKIIKKKKKKFGYLTSLKNIQSCVKVCFNVFFTQYKQKASEEISTAVTCLCYINSTLKCLISIWKRAKILVLVLARILLLLFG